MKQIDYKAEVLKVYPDAKGICLVNPGSKTKYYITCIDEDYSDEKSSPESAWRNAYETLKSQGKIKT